MKCRPLAGCRGVADALRGNLPRSRGSFAFEDTLSVAGCESRRTERYDVHEPELVCCTSDRCVSTALKGVRDKGQLTLFEDFRGNILRHGEVCWDPCSSYP